MTKLRDPHLFPAIVFGCYVGAASSAMARDSIISIHASLLGFTAWFSLAIILACIQGFAIGLVQAVGEIMELEVNEGFKAFLDSLVDWTRMPIALVAMSFVAPDELSYYSPLGLIIMALVQGVATLISLHFFDPGEVDKPQA